MIIKASSFLFGLLIMMHANAETILPNIHQEMFYKDARKVLINDGWKPLSNLKITRSSLYAQELYEQGMSEVVDCISMELDGCSFRFIKNNKTLEVRTITRELKIEKVNIIKNK